MPSLCPTNASISRFCCCVCRLSSTVVSSVFTTPHRENKKWTMLLQIGAVANPRLALAAALAVFLLWLLYITLIASRKRSSYPYPPGPPGKFLVGNLGQLSDHPEYDYIRWGREYSKSPSYIVLRNRQHWLQCLVVFVHRLRLPPFRLRCRPCRSAWPAHDLPEFCQGGHRLARSTGGQLL